MKKDKEKEKQSPPAKDLTELQARLNKRYGSGSVIVGGRIISCDAFPTRIATLDHALGCGGLPMGRIVEIYGMESSGKTTTCLHFIAACQRHYFESKQRYGTVAFIDAEHALDTDWAKKLGVDVDNLLISQPSSGEEIFGILDEYARSGLVDLVIVDSVAAIIPAVMLSGDIEDSNIGVQARLMSKGLNKIKGSCNKSGMTVVFTNQVRMKIGVMFGNPETTPGGNALKFYSSVRLEIRKSTVHKVSETPVSMTVNAKIIKNKVAAPHTKAEYDICFGTPELPVCGVDLIGSLFNMAVDCKVIVQRGSNYYYPESERLGIGAPKAIDALRNFSQEAIDELREKTYTAAFANKKVVSVADMDADEAFEGLSKLEELEDGDDDA